MLLKILMFGLFASAQPKLGVVNKDDHRVSFYDVKTLKEEFSVPVGYWPHEIVSTPDGRLAFVSNYGKDHVRSDSPENRPGYTVSIIDMVNRRNMGVFELGENPNCAPHGMAVSNNGRLLFVTCEDRNEVVVISIYDRKVIRRIPTGQAQSHIIVLSPDNMRAYVANFGPGTVSVLDLVRGKLLKVIPVGPGTEGINISADGRSLYAASVLTNLLMKIDTETFTAVKTVATDRSPIRVALTSSHQVVINNSAAGTLQVFNSDLEAEHTINVGHQPIGLYVSGQIAFTATMRDNSVAIVDLQQGAVVNRIHTGQKPDGIFLIP